jgi:isoleucyl-tRNA synthetase
VEVDGDAYIVAEDLLAATAEACGWKLTTEPVMFKGSRLEHLVFRHPFLERDSIAILGDHVTLEQGTGAVHTAPGHGQEDYVIGNEYKLPVYCPVDGAGRFYQAGGVAGELPGELLGKSVWEGNAIVIGLLERAGALLAQQKIDHSYPHCWRCHRPTIFRATEQWFIAMDHNDLRRRTLDAIKEVKWTPAWGEERMSNMVATRPDWCISRQKVWGVPITVFYCESCQEPLTDRKILDRVVALFREQSVDVWYEKTAAELIGPGVACAKCGGTAFRKEADILDVWFDSGVSHLAVLTPENQLPWPADLYLEGGDQYRGWFQSSLLAGMALKGAAPYRAAGTPGWTLDGEGRALSKSRGEEAVEKIINKYGADLVRLWTASVDFTEDVRFSDTILDRLIEAYRKLRNTFRYALGNLPDFDPVADAVPAEDMLDIDRWILARAEDLVRKCRGWYDSLEFHKVYRAIYDFATADLSSVYFDVLKDRLYTAAARSRARRSGQTALYRVHYALTRLAAPLLAFTTEEVWSYTQKPDDAPDSVHLALLPEPEELSAGLTEAHRARVRDWDRLMELRQPVLKVLEEARQAKFIGAPLEARVRLLASGKDFAVLESYSADLPSLFIVSEVNLEQADTINGPLGVLAERASGTKCERCWKYTQDVGQDADHPTVCAPCAAALREMFG